MYPEYVEVEGKEYKIDTDFNTALKCFEVIEDDTIGDYERAKAVCYLLLDFIPKDEELEKFLNKLTIYLQCGKTIEEHKKNKQDMDFIQDRGYINASFMSTYHLDLSKEKLHFWQFVENIEGLTEDCILNRVRDIRNYDLSEEKNPKRRREMQEAKQKVALKKKVEKLSKEQEKSINELNKLIGLERK